MPDNVGGFVRLPEIPEIMRVAAPVYLKFGLRNAADCIPRDAPRGDDRRANARARAPHRLGMELLAREWEGCETSELGARRLALVHA